jgi:uncharacterized membrane protein YecN with MAPEG domain
VRKSYWQSLLLACYVAGFIFAFGQITHRIETEQTYSENARSGAWFGGFYLALAWPIYYPLRISWWAQSSDPSFRL